jgi:hypothetical protein
VAHVFLISGFSQPLSPISPVGWTLTLALEWFFPKYSPKPLLVSKTVVQSPWFFHYQHRYSPHYRPMMNVLKRPASVGGTAIMLSGRHGLLIPLLAFAVVEALEKNNA